MSRGEGPEPDIWDPSLVFRGEGPEPDIWDPSFLAGTVPLMEAGRRRRELEKVEANAKPTQIPAT